MDWQEVITELKKKSQEVSDTCPDEIKRFHYGIITHSDAGKHAFNQYFGHWVHAYGMYMAFAGTYCNMVRDLSADDDYKLKNLIKMFRLFVMPPGEEKLLREYTGQITLADAVDLVISVLDSLTTKEQLIAVIDAFQNLTGALYAWFHWYFPWGLGMHCQRLTPEDIQEMVRLSQTKK